MAKPKTETTYIRETKTSMESCGVYRKEKYTLIKIYAGLLFQYDKYLILLDEEDYDPKETVVSNKGAVSEKKSPLVSTMETLRKDILAYSDRLCLNPKALNDEKYRRDKLEPQGIEATIANVMGDFDGY